MSINIYAPAVYRSRNILRRVQDELRDESKKTICFFADMIIDKMEKACLRLILKIRFKLGSLCRLCEDLQNFPVLYGINL